MRAEIDISDDLWIKIRKTADLRGLTIDQLITSAVEKEISVYESEETGLTPARLKGWIFQDGTPVEKWDDCVILKEITMMGNPYYRIYVPKEDTIRSVPKELVLIK